MESELDEWMKAQRERGCLLSSFTIKVKAVEIEREICSKNIEKAKTNTTTLSILSSAITKKLKTQLIKKIAME